MRKSVLGLVAVLLMLPVGLFSSCKEKKEASPLSQEQVVDARQGEMRAAEKEFERIFLLIADDMDREGLDLTEEIAKSSLPMDAKEALLMLYFNLKELSLGDSTLRALGDDGGDYTDYLTEDQKISRKKEILEATGEALVEIFINMNPGGAVDKATKRLREIREKYEKMAQDNGYKK